MNRISLTSSMRSNLLSLQNISRQVGSTQNRLATGNKVNSAIDNPGSYYTARSLNNRADDLNALLDSMGQAVSTIKAATTALEAGADFLEQAAAVATGALETAKIPSKSWFEQQEGVAAVVSSWDDLKAALDSGKTGNIVIYGHIEAQDTITLNAGQNLVGVGYYGISEPDVDKVSRITLVNDTARSLINVASPDIMISDLTLTFESAVRSGQSVIATATNSSLHNLDIVMNCSDIREDASADSYGIKIRDSGASISGQTTIRTTIPNKQRFMGLFQGSNRSGWEATLKQESELRILNSSIGLYCSEINIEDDALLFVEAASFSGYLTNMNLQGSGSKVILAQGILTAGNWGEVPRNVFSMVEGASITLETGNTYTAAQTFSNVRMMAAQSAENLTTEFLDKVTKDKKIDIEDYRPVLTPNEDKKADNSLYTQTLAQYDALIKDASYKGINLLQGDKLNVKFNESGSAALLVKGRNMSSAALGLQMMDWQTQGDIAQSLKEISAALKSIRSYSAELGNNYSIITNRQDFTENLINILTEGADKLTLADMNEESANMLALQTRQQLAINSLSLASQASQAVLKLF